MKFYFLAAFSMLLCSCATVNPFAQYYEPTAAPGSLRPYELNGPVRVIKVGPESGRETLLSMASKGYAEVGRSSFYGPTRGYSEQYLLDQADVVGAHVVLLVSGHMDTISGSRPLTLPTTSTSYSNGAATAYGNGGMVNAYGSSATTVYGTQTTYVPYSVDRSTFDAIFLVKNHFKIGVSLADLDDAEKQLIESNSGAIVRVVMEGSPAFAAEVLPGDILKAIDGVPVTGQAQAGELFSENTGNTMVLDLIRNGKKIKKKLTLHYDDGSPSVVNVRN